MITVLAGDGQLGKPGAVLTVKPVVAVNDAGGLGVAGVTVNFSVDSGGGSLQSSSAVTAVDGKASPGDWTLGPAEGRNVLRVTAGTLAAVKAAATARLETVTVGSETFGTGGGALVVGGSGPLAGLRIEVPAGAFATSATVAVSSGSSFGIPIDSIGRIASPLVTIETDASGLANAALKIRIPAKIEPGEFPLIAFVDPQTGFIDALPTLSFDATGVTARAGALTATPDLPLTGQSVLQASRGSRSIKAQLVVLASKVAIGLVQKTTGFVPGVDDWDFARQATPAGPTALGQVITERFYFLQKKALSGKPLWQRYDKALGVPTSNSAGIYWTAGVSKDLEPFAATRINEAIVDHDMNAAQNDLYALNYVVQSMLYSGGKPQTISLIDVVSRRAADALAYQWDGPSGTLSHASPYSPGATDKKSRWVNFRLLDCPSSTCLMVVGLNYLTAGLEPQWAPFQTGTLYKNLFPLLGIGWHSAAQGGPAVNNAITGDTLFLLQDTTSVWSTIPSWPYELLSDVPGLTKVQHSNLYSERSADSWTPSGYGSSNNLELLDVAALRTSGTDRGVNRRVALESRGAWPPLGDADSTRWAGFNLFQVIKYVPKITLTTAAPGSPTQFFLTTEGGPPLPADYRYRFDWGDQTTNTFTAKPASITHTYAEQAERAVTLEIIHPGSGQVVSRAAIGINGILLSPKPLDGQYDTDYQLTGTWSGAQPTNPIWEWNLGDGRTLTTSTNKVTFRYPSPFSGDDKTFNVLVTLKDGANMVATGRSTSNMTGPVVAWKFTSTTLTWSAVGQQINSDGRWITDSTRLARINGLQSQGGVFVVEQPYLSTCNNACALHTVPDGLFLQEGPSITLATISNPVNLNARGKDVFPGAPVTLLAAPLVSSWAVIQRLQTSPTPYCNNPGQFFDRSGDATNGLIRGNYTHYCYGPNENVNVPLANGEPRITVAANITFTGITASGSMTLTYLFYQMSNGNLVTQRKIATLNFQATRVR